MHSSPIPTAVLLIYCPDQKGIVAAVTQFLTQNNGNIFSLDQHVDTERNMFFMRVSFALSGFTIAVEAIESRFMQAVGERYQMQATCHFSFDRPKMAVFVSQMSHCLYDILARYQAKEWAVEIPLIVSNHERLRSVSEQFGIDFHYLPVSPQNKAEQEAQQLDLLADYQVDFIVLARYMQILSPDFIQHYTHQIINIHHSFLPAFPGAKPYHSAQKRGVKIIGATSHYVTEVLDAGPIIEQDVVRVSHKDTVRDLIRKGKDLEKIVLSRAIWHHLNHKMLVFENRTVIFD